MSNYKFYQIFVFLAQVHCEISCGVLTRSTAELLAVQGTCCATVGLASWSSTD